MSEDPTCAVCAIPLELAAPGYRVCPACSTVWPDDSEPVLRVAAGA